MIVLKSRAEIAQMREAGRIVARVHEAMREMIKPGVTTAELNARAEAIIRAELDRSASVVGCSPLSPHGHE